MISTQEFEEMSGGDGSFHLSPMLIGEETKEVATMMHENGASDAEIGKMMRHHVHDAGEENGLTVMVFRHSKQPGIYGVSTIIPNSEWYEMFFSDISAQDEQPPARVKNYGVPATKSAKAVIENELVTKPWGAERVQMEGDFK